MEKSFALNCLRQTGRTTRMLEEAVAVGNRGRHVVVIVDNISDRDRIVSLPWLEKVLDYWTGSFTKTNIPSGVELHAVTGALPLPGASITLIVAPPGCNVMKLTKVWLGQEKLRTFIDHAVIERRYHSVLKHVYRNVEAAKIQQLPTREGTSSFLYAAQPGLEMFSSGEEISQEEFLSYLDQNVIAPGRSELAFTEAAAINSFHREFEVLHAYDKYVLLPAG